MSESYGFSLKTARQAARLTQEQAAEVVGVSVESWKAYEYDDRLPPMDTAKRICVALGAPWLVLEYMNHSMGILGVVPTLTAQELSVAVIALVNRVFAFVDHRRDRQLLAIAEDGIIDESEEQLFAENMEVLDGIICAALALKYPKGIKKDHSDAGTSKRSVQGRTSENDCGSIVSSLGGKCKP